MDATQPSARRRGLGRRSLLVGSAATAMVALTKPGLAFADTTINGGFQTGYDNGWFYTFWTDTPGSTEMVLKSGGQYTLSWNNTGNCVCGKGWGNGGWWTVNYWGGY